MRLISLSVEPRSANEFIPHLRPSLPPVQRVIPIWFLLTLPFRQHLRHIPSKTLLPLLLTLPPLLLTLLPLLLTPMSMVYLIICQLSDPLLDAHVPLTERTRQFCLARQRGRACADDDEALCEKWKLIGPPQDVSHEFGTGYLAWGVTFEGKRVVGMRLIMVPRTIPRPVDCPIFCVYGCTKDGSPFWMSSHPYKYLYYKLFSPSRKIYTHCGIGKNGRPTCPNFPPQLYATSKAEYRNAQGLNGLDLFFRYLPFCCS